MMEDKIMIKKLRNIPLVMLITNEALYTVVRASSLTGYIISGIMGTIMIAGCYLCDKKVEAIKK